MGHGPQLEGRWGSGARPRRKQSSLHLAENKHTRDAGRMPCARLRSVISLVQVKPVRLAGWIPPAVFSWHRKGRRLEFSQVCTPEDERGKEFEGA